MEFTEILRFILSILSGLVAAIPLVIQLIKYVQKVKQEQNWNEIVKLVTQLMMTAETKLATGADRKEWVMSMVQTSAKGIDYEITEDDLVKISDLIDSMCSMAKVVNCPTETPTEEQHQTKEE